MTDADIDEIAVERAYWGDRVRLNRAETWELWRRITAEMARNRELTGPAVARRLHVCDRTVTRWVARMKVAGQQAPERRVRHLALYDAATLRRWYWQEGLSQRAIGDRIGCHNVTVSKAFVRHGIPTRTPAEGRLMTMARTRAEALTRAAA